MHFGAPIVGGQVGIGGKAGFQGHRLEPRIAAYQVDPLAIAIGISLEKPEAHGALECPGTLRDDKSDLVLEAEIPEAIDEVGDLLVGFDVEQLGQSLHSFNTSPPFIPETSLIVELLRCQVFSAALRPSSP
jgi:hypothetical protein